MKFWLYVFLFFGCITTIMAGLGITDAFSSEQFINYYLSLRFDFATSVHRFLSTALQDNLQNLASFKWEVGRPGINAVIGLSAIFDCIFVAFQFIGVVFSYILIVVEMILNLFVFVGSAIAWFFGGAHSVLVVSDML